MPRFAARAGVVGGGRDYAALRRESWGRGLGAALGYAGLWVGLTWPPFKLPPLASPIASSRPSGTKLSAVVGDLAFTEGRALESLRDCEAAPEGG